MITRGWVGPFIGLVVSLLLYVLLTPVFPANAQEIVGIVLILAAVVCALLLVFSFVRRN